MTMIKFNDGALIQRHRKDRSNLCALAMMIVLVSLAGCIQVAAPDKPIVINLNINIKQEVVYRLNDDAQKLIEEEADIF